MIGTIHFHHFIQKRKNASLKRKAKKARKRVEKSLQRVVKKINNPDEPLTKHERDCLFAGAPELFAHHKTGYDEDFENAVIMCLNIQSRYRV